MHFPLLHWNSPVVEKHGSNARLTFSRTYYIWGWLQRRKSSNGTCAKIFQRQWLNTRAEDVVKQCKKQMRSQKLDEHIELMDEESENPEEGKGGRREGKKIYYNTALPLFDVWSTRYSIAWLAIHNQHLCTLASDNTAVFWCIILPLKPDSNIQVFQVTGQRCGALLGALYPHVAAVELSCNCCV